MNHREGVVEKLRNLPPKQKEFLYAQFYSARMIPVATGNVMSVLDCDRQTQDLAEILGFSQKTREMIEKRTRRELDLFHEVVYVLAKKRHLSAVAG